MKQKLKLILHYFQDDPDCFGDFGSADIYLNDRRIAELQDHYHDKPEEKFEGMSILLKDIFGEDKVEIIKEEVADYEG